jgi:prepilin-type N-terminal cleavage/methylation domain-containing protein
MKTTDFSNRRATTKARSARGFTMLELMIAVAIVAVMTAIAAPP